MSDVRSDDVNDEQAPSLRERTRRAVQGELTEVAQDLFVANGYDNTTVDAIATAAGMSKRSFFRYFASKEDLVIGKYELFGQRLAEALAAAPAYEPVWVSLRRVLDLMVGYVVDDASRGRAETMEVIVESSPQLKAGYLAKQAGWNRLLADVVRERLVSSGVEVPDDDPVPAALVGAAFACFQAARTTWLSSDRSRNFDDLLDETMAALQPKTRE